MVYNRAEAWYSGTNDEPTIGQNDMAKNLEKLVMTRALVKEEIRAGKWDQTQWISDLKVDEETGVYEPSCGSSACVAGWAVITDGGKFLSYDTVLARPDEVSDPNVYTRRDYDLKGDLVTVTTIRERARRILGLSNHEAGYLFHGSNSEETVMRVLGDYIKEARRERKAAAKNARKKANA